MTEPKTAREEMLEQEQRLTDAGYSIEGHGSTVGNTAPDWDIQVVANLKTVEQVTDFLSRGYGT